MNVIKFIFIVFFIKISKQSTPILVGEFAYSDAFPINDQIIFCYKKKYTEEEGDIGGIARYEYYLSRISDSNIDEFSNIYETIKIYYINNNSFLLFSRSKIYILKNYLVVHTNSPSNSFIDLTIISESKFLTLSFQNSLGYIIYNLYDITSETDFDVDTPTYKTFTTIKEYNNIKCQKFILSSQNYIFCLMSFSGTKEATYYNTLDDSLNEIIPETEFLEDPFPQGRNQYIFMLPFSDTIIFALLVKYYEECPDFVCDSYLISIEIVNSDNTINIIKKMKYLSECI